ncbi:ParA family protein [Paenibacillus popilliae]|uniref:ParA family protein n=2 Tax=Paenibacillus popilliae TaxID=78057 RepID=A0ABY3APG0_PAEPP|nr:ParA family protein [Paenibacillus sp. SDF0028]
MGMEKLSLVIGSSEQDYLEMLISYVRQSEFVSSISIKAFSNKEHLISYLNKPSLTHITLVEPDFIDEAEIRESWGMLIFLTNSQFSKQSEAYPSVFKYQPIHLLISTVKTLYLEQHEVIAEQSVGNGNAKVISFYSMVGGTGKTTAALNLSRELSLAGMKVMYINLEDISSLPVWFNTKPGHGFAEILYYVKSNKKQVIAKVNQHKKTDIDSGLVYIEPITNHSEIEDITREDVISLIEVIVQSMDYDYVVLDCETSFHERIMGALECSHHILCFVLDDIQCIYKTEIGLSYMEASDPNKYSHIFSKMHFILNKYTGTVSNEINFTDLGIEGYLPYVPKWKNVKSGEALLASQEFNTEVLRLITLFAQGSDRA